jgi:hypothetical protein
MNAVEIEEALPVLVASEFDRDLFPYKFLSAFGNSDTTIARLRNGKANKSDLTGGVLQRSNIHILVCESGGILDAMDSLRASEESKKAKVKFLLATDGEDVLAENCSDSDLLACAFEDLGAHFGFFLSLAGITPVEKIKNNPVDIKATGRLNKLYVELLRYNETMASSDDTESMNHFMACLIFCFFAEDTEIFPGQNLFTRTVSTMSDSRSGNTGEILKIIFTALGSSYEKRDELGLPIWVNEFPYVNGGLFNNISEIPKFNRIARSYLLHAGELDWKTISPDIFGSMIQAITDPQEREGLGMHYTSVPNILKVLNPLFLDNLVQLFEQAKKSPRKLLALKDRLSRVIVFDPACGAGNFLVVAYKKLREIENQINILRGETHLRSVIKLQNFRGIELKQFPAEISRLSLIIAEFQCDVLYLGQKDAIKEFLPLDQDNWIVCANALRTDWLKVCAPNNDSNRFSRTTSNTSDRISIEKEFNEVFLCSNPPYLGSTWQSQQQKDDLKGVFTHYHNDWKILDYVAGWVVKCAEYTAATGATCALVSTNSICQGQQVPKLWPFIKKIGVEIVFAHESFTWSNLAAYKAGVTVVILGLGIKTSGAKYLYSSASDGTESKTEVSNINSYLVSGPDINLEKSLEPLNKLNPMERGSKPADGGSLLLDFCEAENLRKTDPEMAGRFIRRFVGSDEVINGKLRYCLWISDEDADVAAAHKEINDRLVLVKKMREASAKKQTNRSAATPHKFAEIRHRESKFSFAVPIVSSENRDYLPFAPVPDGTIISDRNFALYDPPLWNIAILSSRLHLIWIATVCVRLRTDFSYSNTLGWNTFPLPILTKKNMEDLAISATNILLARETLFPMTLSEMYSRSNMPELLRNAHEANDEVLERIYCGRRMRNDSERLSMLFEAFEETTRLAPQGAST